MRRNTDFRIPGWYLLKDERGWEYAFNQVWMPVRGAYNPRQGIPRHVWIEALGRLHAARTKENRVRSQGAGNTDALH